MLVFLLCMMRPVVATTGLELFKEYCDGDINFITETFKYILHITQTQDEAGGWGYCIRMDENDADWINELFKTEARGAVVIDILREESFSEEEMFTCNDDESIQCVREKLFGLVEKEEEWFKGVIHDTVDRWLGDDAQDTWEDIVL